MTFALILAVMSLVIWAYLLVGRGGFWLASERDDRGGKPLSLSGPWPRVVAVIPARDEAEVVAGCLNSLLHQDYPGAFSIVLVDDQSTDGTADLARAVAAEAGAGERLTVLSGAPLPEGWTGKLWAVHQGVGHVMALPQPPTYILLSDADIAYESGALTALVTRARLGGFTLTSLMVKLRCQSFVERALIPAFIFFFQKLYPFTWVNRGNASVAAAAGGCMLVRRDTLADIGGIASIRNELIDDCALGRKLKARGPIWLGLTNSVRSLRPYANLGEIRRMVARTAYAQLNYSPLMLVLTVIGMILTYLVPPILAFAASGAAQIVGIVAWVVMALSFIPTLLFYRRWPFWGIVLPVIAGVYLVFTIDSAYQHRRGRGGLWKGRAQAHGPKTR